MEDNTCKTGPILSDEVVKATFFRNEILDEVADKVESTYTQGSPLHIVLKGIADNIRAMKVEHVRTISIPVRITLVIENSDNVEKVAEDFINMLNPSENELHTYNQTAIAEGVFAPNVQVISAKIETV